GGALGGVDPAGVGPGFGGARPNTPPFLELVAAEDRRMLAAVTASEPAAFFASVAADGDSRRICGLSPIYAFLRALPGSRGELLRYTQWPAPQGAVTYCAGALFVRRPAILRPGSFPGCASIAREPGSTRTKKSRTKASS